MSARTKRALICGVSGQDGAYLAKLLLSKGYEVYGTSRDAHRASFNNLVRLGVREQVAVESISVVDSQSVLQALRKIEPDEVYNLAGQSSVALSFKQPVETIDGMARGTLNLLEAIRSTGRPVRLYNAASSESFGETSQPADEATAFRPRSPYGVAKAAAFWEVVNYREAFGVFACSGILFNHESPLRPAHFVTRKIVSAACRIAGGSDEKLELGKISVERDWGWAPEYVESMWLMLQQEKPQDYVIATGEPHTLEEFVGTAFSSVGLDWREHCELKAELVRPTDIAVAHAKPTRAFEELGWQARYKMNDVVRMMISAECAEAPQDLR
jgi:GDPmannose 4,6-dehydratase